MATRTSEFRKLCKLLRYLIKQEEAEIQQEYLNKLAENERKYGSPCLEFTQMAYVAEGKNAFTPTEQEHMAQCPDCQRLERNIKNAFESGLVD